MNQTMWLAQRTLLAMVLMLGFYGLAIAIALGLLWIPYAEWKYVERVDFRIAVFCIGSGLTVLWALAPRRDRFDPPGPRLDEAGQPRLFELLRETAASAGQAMPADVYLLNEVNAWVAHRGGVMGFGSRRVMGVGLPLLQVLTISEFRAVIAHEYGHYASGDVQLGPWIYKTRAAIGRTIAGVRATFLERPFLWYGRLFLKLTHAVSRRQEFIADQVAARIAGTAAMASALRRVTGIVPTFNQYVRSEVLPVLRAGFLPPIAAGFDQYLRDDAVAKASRQIVQAAEENGRTDEFDTHPSLRDRIAALGASVDPGSSPIHTGSAIALIGDAEQHARALTEYALGRDAVRQLTSIDWSVVGERVYAAGWRHIVTSQAKGLGRLMADSIPSGKQAFIGLRLDLVRADEQNINGEERIARAVYVLAVAIAVLLLDSGWRAETAPGRPVVLVRDDDVFEPFDAVNRLAEGKTTVAEWAARCIALGIEGRPLSGVQTSAV